MNRMTSSARWIVIALLVVIACGCDEIEYLEHPTNRDCQPGSTLQGHECVCNEGLTRCVDPSAPLYQSIVCTSLNDDPEHCGACVKKCPTNANCEDGACVCPQGTEPCGDACVDLLTNRAHCGECDNRCYSPYLCEEGECVCSDGASCEE